MSRTRHPEERGTPLAYKRWRRRNVPPTPGRAIQHERDELAETLLDMELSCQDPEVWLYRTNLVTYADTRPKLRAQAPRSIYNEQGEYDPLGYYPREDTWYWDEFYDYRDSWYDYDYRDDDSYGGYDDVAYLDAREAPWVAAWLAGDVDDRENSWDWEYDYWYDDCLADREEVEGAEEFFATDEVAPVLPDLPRIRAREKRKAGDRYYRTHRRAA